MASEHLSIERRISTEKAGRRQMGRISRQREHEQLSHARFSMKHDRLCVENTETPSYRYRTQGIDSLSKEV